MGMKKFKYQSKEVGQINNILHKYGVALSFENLNCYYKSIEEIAPLIHKSYERYLKSDLDESDVQKNVLAPKFDENREMRIFEYDIEDMHIISNGGIYPIRSFDACPQFQIKTHIHETLKLFDFYKGCILDFMGYMCLMYEGSTEQKYEGSHLTMNQDIMYNIPFENWPNFLGILNIPEKHSNFICAEKNGFVLDYSAMNSDEIICKFAFATDPFLFLQKSPEKYYSDYCKISEVVACISEQIADGKLDANVSIQVSPIDADYFAIEYSIKKFDDKRNFRYFIDDIMKHELIDTKTSEMIKKYDFSKCDRVVLKYRWAAKDKFKVKLYVEQFL
jgi:hypothetical protein